MALYEVVSAQHKADKPDRGHGPMKTVNLALKDEAGEVHVAEWYTKASTPVPDQGARLEGEITLGQYGPSFKRSSSGGGMGGPRPEDPARARAIARMHAQTASIAIVDLAVRLELVRPKDTTELFKLIAGTADWLDTDTEKARNAA